MKTLIVELESLNEIEAIRLTNRAKHTLINALKLVEPVDTLIAAIGYLGSINADDGRVHDVLEALNKVDPK